MKNYTVLLPGTRQSNEVILQFIAHLLVSTFNEYIPFKGVCSMHFYACETHDSYDRDSGTGKDCRKPNRAVELSFVILFEFRIIK